MHMLIFIGFYWLLVWCVNLWVVEDPKHMTRMQRFAEIATAIGNFPGASCTISTIAFHKQAASPQAHLFSASSSKSTNFKNQKLATHHGQPLSYFFHKSSVQLNDPCDSPCCSTDHSGSIHVHCFPERSGLQF
jgi:hypothetical protein